MESQASGLAAIAHPKSRVFEESRESEPVGKSKSAVLEKEDVRPQEDGDTDDDRPPDQFKSGEQ